jgi:large-conductance mechanosensitive channel
VATAQSQTLQALVVLQSVFSVMLFVAHALAAHCFLLLEWIIFLAVKSKNQRAAPTAQKQKDTPKKLPEAKLHNVIL